MSIQLQNVNIIGIYPIEYSNHKKWFRILKPFYKLPRPSLKCQRLRMISSGDHLNSIDGKTINAIHVNHRWKMEFHIHKSNPFGKCI